MWSPEVTFCDYDTDSRKTNSHFLLDLYIIPISFVQKISLEIQKAEYNLEISSTKAQYVHQDPDG